MKSEEELMSTEQLLRRLGPWAMAQRGIISEQDRDMIVQGRVGELTDAIDHYWGEVGALVSLIVVLSIGIALGTYVHEGWFIIALLALGSVILTGQLGALLAAPLQLLNYTIRLSSVRKKHWH